MPTRTADPAGMDLLGRRTDRLPQIRAGPSSIRVRAVQQVTVLTDGSRKDHEVDLAITIDHDDPHHSDRLRVAGEEHRTDLDRGRVTRTRQRRPPVAIVVLGVQVSSQVDLIIRTITLDGGAHSHARQPIPQQANHEGSGRPFVLDHLGRHDAPIVIPGQARRPIARSVPRTARRALARIRVPSTTRLKSTVSC